MPDFKITGLTADGRQILDPEEAIKNAVKFIVLKDRQQVKTFDTFEEAKEYLLQLKQEWNTEQKIIIKKKNDNINYCPRVKERGRSR